MDNNEGNGIPDIRKVVPIPSSGNFFRVWVEVLKPIHKLTDREMDLLAAFLKKRNELQLSNMDPDKIDPFLMSSIIKKEIRKSVRISTAYYQRIVRKYRDREVMIPDPNIKGGKINPRFIPNLKDDDKSIKIMFILLNPNDD